MNTAALVAAAVLPLAGFGIVMLLVLDRGDHSLDPTIGRILLFAVASAVVFGVLIAYLLASDLTAPLRAIARAVERVSAGDLTTPIDAPAAMHACSNSSPGAMMPSPRSSAR